MKKSELNKLKTIRKQCGEYANKVCKYSDEIIKIGKNNNCHGNEIKNAIEELNMAMVNLGNAENALIDFIRTEQPDYLQTNYNL